mgnify:CR=1 FL=1
MACLRSFHKISDAPGLGISVDLDAVARFRLDPDDPKASPTFVYQEAPTLYTIVYRDHSCIRYRDDCRTYFIDGDGPVYAKGTRLESRENDGSEEWQRLYDATANGPQRDRMPPTAIPKL